MNDIVNIGFKVNSSQISTGYKRMDKLGVSSEKAERKVNKSSKSMERDFNLVSKAAASAGVALATYVSGREFIRVAREFDVLNASLVTATGSTESAAKQFEVLQNFAATTPYDLAQSVDGFVKLKNLGLDPSIESLESFGNTAAAMGKSLDQMIGAVADASTGEFERLKEFGIKAKSEGDNVSFTFQGVTTTVRKNAQEIQDYLLDIGNVNFSGAMERRAATLDGALSNLGDSWEGLYRTISQAGVGDALNKEIRGVTSQISNLSDFIENNSEAIGDSIGTVATVIGLSTIPAIVAWTRSIYANVAAQLLQNTQAVRTVNYLGQVTVATGSATVATNALAAATRFLLGPWGLLIAAVTAGVATFVSASNEIEKNNKKMADQRKQLDSVTEAYKELTEAGKASARNQLVSQMTDLREASIKARTQIQKLKDDLVFQDAAGRSQLRTRIADLGNETEILDKKYKQALETLNNLRKEDLSGNWKKATEDTKENTNEVNKQIKALKDLQKQLGMTNDELFIYKQEQKSKSNGDAPELTKQIKEQAQAYLDAKNKHEAYMESWQGQDQVSQKALNAARSYDEWVKSITTTSTELARLRDEVDKTQEAVKKGDLTAKVGAEHVGDLNKQIKSLEGDSPFESLAQGATGALSAISQLFEQGSEESQKLLVAVQAVNTAMAVMQAIKSTTTGNVIGAATAGVGLLGSLDTILNKEIKTDFEEIQANQNVNMFGEKADSIAKATEDTAKAVNKVVGINTDMLDALRSLTRSIADASSLIVRETNYDGFPNVKADFKKNGLEYILGSDIGQFLSGDSSKFLGNNFVTNLFDDIVGPIFGALGGLLGGSSKVNDEGVKIIGGRFDQLITNTMVRSYQEVKYKKWRWGSSKTKYGEKALSRSVSAQFQLVFESIGDAVETAAGALGVSQQEIDKRISAFNVATKKISLKGLSADRQEKEIQAYFSRIFNNLTLAVVPFVPQFQKAGEELGETISRLATQVSAANYLADNFGIKFRKTVGNEQAFVAAANNLSELAGGVESLAGGINSFTNNFASDAKKTEIYSNALNESLSKVGLRLPETSDGMWDLMRSLDGMTQQGQEQITTLLGLTDTASAYYDLIEDSTDTAAMKFREAAEGMFKMSESAKQVSLDSALAAARMGDMSKANQLNLNDLSPSKSSFGSMLDYNIARAETADKLNELQDIQDGTITVAQEQLSVLRDIRDTLKNNDTMSNNASDENNVSARDMSNKQEQTNQYLRQMVYAGIDVRVK